MIPTGFSELIILFVIILVLSATGMWPAVVRALRELRGDSVDDAPVHPPKAAQNLDLCFRLLGLSPSASWEEIERAYRQKAKIHHPDRGGDADTMRALNEAYNTLKKTHRPRS